MNNDYYKLLAKLDHMELSKKIGNMSYENAFKVLDGFNLLAEIMLIGNEISVMESFMFKFGHLRGTIFRTNNNMCELHEIYELLICGQPTACLSINSSSEVFIEEIFV